MGCKDGRTSEVDSGESQFCLAGVIELSLFSESQFAVRVLRDRPPTLVEGGLLDFLDLDVFPALVFQIACREITIAGGYTKAVLYVWHLLYKTHTEQTHTVFLR